MCQLPCVCACGRGDRPETERRPRNFGRENASEWVSVSERGSGEMGHPNCVDSPFAHFIDSALDIILSVQP